jgi:hypothetical protein
LDPGSGIEENQDPGSATLVLKQKSWEKKLTFCCHVTGIEEKSGSVIHRYGFADPEHLIHGEKVEIS